MPAAFGCIRPCRTQVDVASCSEASWHQCCSKSPQSACVQVLLDGVDVRDLQLRWYRHQLGLVSQEPILFSATVAGNIAYGCMDIDQAGIEAAAKAAHCHAFISKLPLGYDTPVGERVRSLSTAVSCRALQACMACCSHAIASTELQAARCVPAPCWQLSS